jgi:S1-C subfamily serine protease
VSDQTRDGQTGGLITYIHPDSPAAKAGIKAGMVMLRLRAASQPVPIEIQLEEDFARAQGFPWERLDEIRDQFFERIFTPWPPVETPVTRALTDLGFGTRFTADFVEEGKLLTQEFEVVPGPTHYESAARFKSESLGITVRNLTYDVLRYIQRKADEPGVVVSRIEPGGRASVAGVKPYELITHIQDQPVSTVADFERLVAAEKGDLKLSLKRMAKGRIATIRAVSSETKE